MSRRFPGQPLVRVGIMASLLWATWAWSAVPMTVAVEGRLQADGGGAVADGEYAVTFALYLSQNVQQELWSETVAKLSVKGGVFRHSLGSAKPLDAKLLASKETWLGLRVGSDPELARNRLHAVPYALRVALADGVNCTGCISLAALKADGDLNLGGNAEEQADLNRFGGCRDGDGQRLCGRWQQTHRHQAAGRRLPAR